VTGDYLAETYKNIKVKTDQKTTWIILNRPHRLNAIDSPLLVEFNLALDNAEEDDNVHCIVITAEGEKAFSSGADINALSTLTSQEAERFSKLGQKTFGKMERMSKPVIAAINGSVYGGGLELALACDIRLAAKHAQMGFTEINFGLIPAWGGIQRLVPLVGLAKAKELVMLGKKLKADEALRIGLVHKVVEYSELLEEAKELSAKFCEMSPEALKCAKFVLTFRSQGFMDEGLRLESAFFGSLVSSETFKKDVEAFFSKKLTLNKK
jgi:enoyl-CoA hydratase/carnithine racemase